MKTYDCFQNFFKLLILPYNLNYFSYCAFFFYILRSYQIFLSFLPVQPDFRGARCQLYRSWQLVWGEESGWRVRGRRSRSRRSWRSGTSSRTYISDWKGSRGNTLPILGVNWKKISYILILTTRNLKLSSFKTTLLWVKEIFIIFRKYEHRYLTLRFLNKLKHKNSLKYVTSKNGWEREKKTKTIHNSLDHPVFLYLALEIEDETLRIFVAHPKKEKKS